MTLLGTIQHLYASGLGLMLCSPEAVEGIEAGSDTMPGGNEGLREPLRSLVRSQRVVLLGTGSPQLYYDIEVHDEPPAPGAAARCRFGLRIEGGALWVRDGYDPMKWEPMPDSLKPVPIRDGDYAVEACWIRAADDEDDHGVMKITLHFLAEPMPPVGERWPELLYEAVK